MLWRGTPNAKGKYKLKTLQRGAPLSRPAEPILAIDDTILELLPSAAQT